MDCAWERGWRLRGISAGSVARLGLGAADATAVLTDESVTDKSLRNALEHALRPRTAATALSLTRELRTDGATMAVRGLADPGLLPQI